MSKKGRQFLQEKINGLNWQTLMTKNGRQIFSGKK